MFPTPKIVVATLCMLILLGCRTHPSTDDLIDGVTKNFPKSTFPTTLPPFHLLRSVSFGQPQITIQLFLQEESDRDEDPQQVIIVTNSRALSYAIPYLSNSYHNYWDFQFDNAGQKTYRQKTTFEAELNKCLDTLQLNDTLGTAGTVIDELLNSVLNCRKVELSDSTRILEEALSDENDSCNYRRVKNWKTIAKEISPVHYVVRSAAYWDKQNGRIYLFDFTHLKHRQKNHFKVKVLRQDCLLQKLRM